VKGWGHNMKKIFGILVCMLLIICIISYSVSALNFNNTSSLDIENVITNIKDPLTLRAEVIDFGNRKVLLNAYATNTFDEHISV
jgi:putative cell wall-binding protein